MPALARFAHPERGIEFILNSTPRSAYDAHQDPRFTPAALAEHSRNNTPIPVYTSYNYQTNLQETRTITFQELHEKIYDADYTASIDDARFNEFSRGRENKERLYAAYPGCVFVEYAVSTERGAWRALRLVFAPYGQERAERGTSADQWKLVAVIHDAARE
jgi:hypothetical protein